MARFIEPFRVEPPEYENEEQELESFSGWLPKHNEFGKPDDDTGNTGTIQVESLRAFIRELIVSGKKKKKKKKSKKKRTVRKSRTPFFWFVGGHGPTISSDFDGSGFSGDMGGAGE